MSNSLAPHVYYGEGLSRDGLKKNLQSGHIEFTPTIAKFSVTGGLTFEFNKNLSESQSHTSNLGTSEIVT
jgi:hypothetical protein